MTSIRYVQVLLEGQIELETYDNVEYLAIGEHWVEIKNKEWINDEEGYLEIRHLYRAADILYIRDFTEEDEEDNPEGERQEEADGGSVLPLVSRAAGA